MNLPGSRPGIFLKSGYEYDRRLYRYDYIVAGTFVLQLFGVGKLVDKFVQQRKLVLRQVPELTGDAAIAFPA